MDFVSGLPRTAKNWDSIWVIVDRLTKSAHFIPIRMDCPMERLAELYVEKIVSLHGICCCGKAASKELVFIFTG